MADSFTTEAFTLLGVGVVVIALRTVARATSVGIGGFQFDDYLMLVAAVIYSLETATAYIVGGWWLGLANNGMTDEQRRTLDPASHEYHLRVGGSKTQLVGWSLYTLLLWTLKLCMCHFYSRLSSGIYHLELRVKIGYVLIGVTYIATELSILLGCQPFSNNWQIYPDPGNYCQPAISKIDLYVTVILNVLTDLFLMSIPMPMLWGANLKLKRKLSLIVIFGGGVFVMMAGILRCVLIIQDPINGAQAAGSWACRETFVAVVIGNAPMIYPLFRRGIEKVYSTSGLSRVVHSSSRNNEPRGSVHLRSSLSKPARRGKLRSVNALPTTFNDEAMAGWDSKERIIEETRAVDGGGAGGRGDGASSAASGDVSRRLSEIGEGVEADDQASRHRRAASSTKGGGGGGGRDRSASRSRSRAASAAASINTGLRSARGSLRGSLIVSRTESRADGASSALGGITVTKEAHITTEERGEAQTRTPSPPQAGGYLLEAGEVVEVGRSETPFKYREEEGLEYTAYVGRGQAY
ncbi:hypothetical protein GTA08_BOTSDO03595 [Neofusicoccum parvum]|nr:hypothetical protein GTA08_BOTSDO03595 [Neofusicoccum parvum]